MVGCVKDPERFNPIRFECGVSAIKLTKGRYALVDTEDAERLSKSPWQCRIPPCGPRACRHVPGLGKRQHERGMHREVLGLADDDPREVDHINHDGLDNRKCNLRIVTCQQNQWNKRREANNSSGHRGIAKRQWKTCVRWAARIEHNGTDHYLGSFPSLGQAVAVWEAKARELFGDYAPAYAAALAPSAASEEQAGE